MNPTPSLFLYLKLGIIGLAVAGVFLLAALGRIDANTAIGSIVILVTGLAIALGISAGGAMQASARLRAAGVDETQPVKVPSVPPRGFVQLRLVGVLAIAGLLAVLCFAPRPPSHVDASPAIAAEGCAWWSANSKPVTASAAQIASCVLAQVLTGGVADPLQIDGACVPATIADVEQIIASLISFYDTPVVVDGGATSEMTHSAGVPPPRLDGVTLPQSISWAQLRNLAAVRARALAAEPGAR